MRTFNSMDVGKFIMAFFVIAIHLHPFEYIPLGGWEKLYELLCLCAVPFFFLCSGFLLGKKCDYPNNSISTEHVAHALRKTLCLYLVWTIIYFPLAIVGYWLDDFSFTKDVILYFKDLILVGEHWNSWILWYLLSLTYALAFVHFMLKKRFSMRGILIGGIIMFFVGTAITTLVNYTGELPKVLFYLRKILFGTIVSGRLFLAFLYLPLGIMLSAYRLRKMIGALLTLIAIGLLYTPLADIMFIHPLIVVMAAVGIFIFFNAFELKQRSIYAKLRTTGTIMYFTHLWVFAIIYLFIVQPKEYGFSLYVIVTLFTLLLSVIYLHSKPLRDITSSIWHRCSAMLSH